MTDGKEELKELDKAIGDLKNIVGKTLDSMNKNIE